MRAVIAGATGLVGSELLQALLKDPDVESVTTLVRKPIGVSHPKLSVVITGFSQPADYACIPDKGDTIFCCIGTTQRKVRGNKQAYRKIDYEIPLEMARTGLEKGYRHFLLVSAIGAYPGSSNFYLRLKGEVERDLGALPFESIHFFRPSVLLGKRKESRPGELVAKGLMTLLAPLLTGKWKKYRPIEARTVAKAMLEACKNPSKGTWIHEFSEMQALGMKTGKI